MAPQTRSMAKSSPGRSTRNSVYGRSLLPPSSTQKSSTDKSAVHAQAQNAERNATLNTSGGKGTPWLACRDAYGIMTTVAVSETGEGTHMRWYYPEEDIEVDEDEEARVEMIIDEPDSRGVTPVTAGPIYRPFPNTPMPLHPFDAGSVIKTPMKKPRPLQASPPRIGDKGIRCLYEDGSVLRDLNGEGIRVVLHHPVGSTANLSREQVEVLQKEQEDKIARAQIAKLLEEKKRLDEEERAFSECGYNDSETGHAISLTSSTTPSGPGFRRVRLGPEGTELID